MINDGTLSSAAAATINITAVNDAPVIDLLTTAGVQTTAITAAFTESGGAVTVAPQLTLADVDSTTAAGATVTLTNAQTGDVLSLQGQAGTSGTLAGGIGFSISGSTVTFSNVSLLANYQAALQLVQFNNTSVTPITTDRSFAFQIDDGGVVNNLANATATVTIGTVNHAPTTADTSASGAEDGGAIAIVLSGNDIDGTVASFAITSLPTNGTLSTDAAGLNPVALNQLITASGNAATLYFTPAANFNGAPSFQYAAIDNNGAQDATPATATINITAVDDAPVATITPTSYGPVNEQTSLTLHGTGLSISDVDAGSGSLTVTLSVTEGTLNVTGGSTGAGVSASGSSLVTITGTQTQINNLLAGNGGATVTYLDNTDTPSATVTLTLTVNDNGLTGTGGPLSASDTATINITAVDDAPVATITPTSYGPVNEQTSLTLHGTGLSISDVDAGSGSLTVTLSVTEGTLNVTGGSTGAGVSASGSSLVTITGTQTQINNLLAGNGGATVTYLDNTDTPSATVTLTLTVNDNGLTGTGGPLSASDTATINITAVNDAPVIDLLTTAGVQTTAITAAFTENGGAVTVAPQLTLADVDSTTAAGATVTLTNAQTGDVLSLQGQAGTSGTLAGGIGFSISGSTVTFSNVSLLANYQAALQLVQFNNTSVNPITTDRSFAFQIDDGGVVNNLANATATVTIGTVNHAPTTADTSASGAEDGGAIAIVLSGNDIDGTVASFTITSLPTNGTLSTDAAGLNPVALNQLITASGNAATLYFTPAANFNGAPSFQYAAIDNNGAQDATPATATINITAVDDAPVATITPTSYGPVNEQTSLTLHGTGLSISDVDAGSGSLTVTLSVTEGTLNVTGGSTGAGVSASGSSLVTITGTQTQINNLLAGNGGATVTYLDNTDTPSATVTLTLTVNDNGLTGTGGPLSASDTATINITAVNDAPVIDLLTTAGVQTTAITAAFTESGGAVTVAPQLTLADVDGTTAAGATVTLTNAQTGDVLSLQGQAGTSGTLAGGIGFSISGSTVTFSNVSLLANYQAALQLVQFNNTSVTPITTDRSFAFQIDDGGVVNNLANATATVTMGRLTTRRRRPIPRRRVRRMAGRLRSCCRATTSMGRWHRSRLPACRRTAHCRPTQLG